MEKLKHILILLSLTLLLSNCNKEEAEDTPVDIKPSSSAELKVLDVVVDNSVYPIYASNRDMSELAWLPPGTQAVTISEINISGSATIDIEVGDEFSIAEFPLEVTVTAEDGVTTKTYKVDFNIAQETLFVHKHGLLKTKGNRIVNKHDEVVSFAGNSFFWSNDGWGSEAFYNASVVKWLKDDWNTKIVRVALGVDENGGYLENREGNKERIITVLEAAIKEGLYVIVDWHSHHAEDYKSEANEFFSEISSLYGKYENVIYEVYNEPLDVSWSDVLKPYAESVISTIRYNNSSNLIVVGTPEWSQRVDLASEDPITGFSNIAYCLHFYTIHHQQWLRDKADIALGRGVALFITEYGSIGYTQDDPELEAWMDWCRENDISHCNWAVNDKKEEWSIVKPGTDPTGSWVEDDLTEAGKLSKSIIQNWDE